MGKEFSANFDRCTVQAWQPSSDFSNSWSPSTILIQSMRLYGVILIPGFIRVLHIRRVPLKYEDLASV